MPFTHNHSSTTSWLLGSDLVKLVIIVCMYISSLLCFVTFFMMNESGVQADKDFHVGHMISLRFLALSLVWVQMIFSLLYWSENYSCLLKHATSYAIFVSYIILVWPLCYDVCGKGYWVHYLILILMELN